MIKMHYVALVLLGILASTSFGKPLSPDEALASFRLETADLQVRLVAAEPEVVDPVALCFDRKGRLYVVESRGYPHAGKGLPKAQSGGVARLEDRDGDGRFEKRTEFARDLTFPNGILPWKKGFFVTDAPDLLFLEDLDDDGVADTREVVLTGFFTNSSSEQLRVASPTLGPDGWIYLTSGLAGGKVTSPMHPGRAPVEARKNDWRFHPETRVVESLTSAGQAGQAFDRDGRRFVCDNRHPLRWAVFGPGVLGKNPHVSGTPPVMDLAEAGSATPLFPLAPDTTAASYMPKLMQRPHAGSFTSCCGLCFFTGDALPRHRGSFFICEPAQNLVHCRSMVETHEELSSRPSSVGREFLASPDQWFRPVFAANGPDGALYLCDMYRKYIDHPNYLPPEATTDMDFAAGKQRGRIWRVSSRSDAAPAAWHQSKGVGLAIRQALKGGALPDLAALAGKSGANPWFRAALFSSCPGQAGDLLDELPGVAPPELFEQAAQILSREEPAATLPAVIHELWQKKKGFAFAQRVAFLLGFPENLRKPYHAELQPRALALSLNGQSPGADRLTAIRFLEPANRLQLLGLLEPAQPADIRAAAIRSLAGAGDPDLGGKLLAVHATLPPEDAIVVIDALLSRRSLHPLVLDALESASLPLHAVSLNQRRRLTGNPGVKARASKLFESADNSDRMKVYRELKKVLDLPADAAAGQAIYQRACASCHKLGDAGHAVGPDLTGLRNQPADALLLHLVVPNREVYPGYALYQVETKDGALHAGILEGESPGSVTLVLPLGLRKTIPRSKLKSLRALPVSLMPNGLEQTMSLQELANLIALIRQ
jgi:putative membrane-bound dehydrogenase-like protein